MSGGAAEPLERLADDAARWVTAEARRRQSRLVALPGSDGRLPTEQDLRDHLAFLAAALATGAPNFFVDYIRWLAIVHGSRGMPIQALEVSLDLFRQFFERSLPPLLGEGTLKVLDQGRRALAETPNPASPLADRPDDLPHVGLLTRYLIEGNVTDAQALTRTAWEASGDYVVIATRLFQPALYDVGILWERNKITVAQEHLATAMSQTLLTRLFLTAALFAKPTGRSALFAGVAGNQHVVGVRMLSDAFELAGWSVQYLGADTPTDALVAHVGTICPEVVGLSASMVQHLLTLRDAVDALKAELGTKCPIIVVGGLPINQRDDVWRWIGADACYANASQAVKGMGHS